MFGSSFSRSFRYGERPAISQGQIAATANIWYDAASPSYFQPSNPVNNDLLAQWNDRSAAAHNASPQGGNSAKPKYVIPAQNGYGAVDFASGNNMQINAGNTPNWLSAQAGFAMFIVAKLSTNTTGTRTLVVSDTGGYKIQYGGGTWTVTAASGTGTVAITANNSYHIFALLYDGSQSGNASRLRFRYDAAQQTLNFGATTVGTTTSGATKILNLAYDGSTNYWIGEIAEVLLFTSAQNSTQVGLIEGYLKNKWAL